MVPDAVVFEAEAAEKFSGQIRVFFTIKLSHFLHHRIGILHITGIELEMFLDIFFRDALKRWYIELFFFEFFHSKNIIQYAYELCTKILARMLRGSANFGQYFRLA